MNPNKLILHENLFFFIENHFPKRKGLIFGLLSAFLISFTALFSKSLKGLSAFEILFYRSVFSLLYQISFMYSKSTKLNFKLIFQRNYLIYGSLSFFCSYLFIMGLVRMNFSDAIILFHTSPIFSLIVSFVLVEKKIYLNELFAVFLSFIGVILIVKSDYSFDLNLELISLTPFCICLTQAFLTALRTHISKSFNNDNFASLSYLLIYLILGFICMNFTINNIRTPQFYELGILALTGLFGIFSEYLTIKSLRTESSTVILIIKSMRIVISFIFDSLFFGNIPKIGSILGAGLIFFGTVKLIK